MNDLPTDKVPYNYPENDYANESYKEWGVGKQSVFREIDDAVKCRAEE
jgi:hypothetical protein